MRTALLLLLCFSAPAAAQQSLPPLDPAIQLNVCQQQRAVFLSDSEQAQAYARQFLAEIAKLKAEIEELKKAQAKPE